MSLRPATSGNRLKRDELPVKNITRFKIRSRKKTDSVMGNVQKNSFSAFIKSFMNHKSIENTAFRMFIQKLVTAFIATEIIENIYLKNFSPTKLF